MLQSKQRKVNCSCRESTKLGYSGEEFHFRAWLSMGFAQQPKSTTCRYLRQPRGRNIQLLGSVWLSHVYGDYEIDGLAWTT